MRHLNSIITVVLIALLILSSCSNKQIYSSQEKGSSGNVIVKTHDGLTYHLPWYVVTDSMLISRLNTARYLFDEQQILDIAVYAPDPQMVDLQTALDHDGFVSLVAYDQEKNVHHYKFYDIDRRFDQIVGYKFLENYPAEIRIPLSNIKHIEQPKKPSNRMSEEEMLLWFYAALVITDAILWGTGSYPYCY